MTRNFWYKTPQELVNFLKTEKTEDKFYYKPIDDDLLEASRTKSNELKIKGCLKARMMSFLSDGSYYVQRHICSCKQCSLGNIHHCSMVEQRSDVEVEDRDDELCDIDEDADVSDNNFEFVEPGTYIGLFSLPNSFEPFIACQVIDKGIAEEDAVDFNGHVVQRGDKFVTGVHLEEVQKKNGRVYYKKH